MHQQNIAYSCVVIVLGIVLHPVRFDIKNKTELERHGVMY